MSITIQIKVLYYSFFSGIIFYLVQRILRNIKRKEVEKILIYIINIIFFLLYYYLLYKINYGILSSYLFISFIIGMFFCKILYFKRKSIWNFNIKII